MEQFQEGLVSIIIPVFNRASLLPETLDSIVSQTYVNWECIIVDDGSTDSSLNVAMEYAMKDNRFSVYSRSWYKKKGANSCRNYGFELSKGEFIQWFDSDDIMIKDNIICKYNQLIKNNVDLVVCETSLFYSSGQNKKHEISFSIEFVTDNKAFEYFISGHYFQTSQVMFTRKSLLLLPYIFNVNLKRNQETELLVRLILQHVKISFLKQKLVFIRSHQNSITGNYKEMSDSNQMLFDLDAYISIFLSLISHGKKSDEILLYFSNFFYRCLRKMELDYIKYFKLFFFGLRYNLFPSKIAGSKIFIYRIINE
jgi:glycosyltransferase involved in cell wall biosynthesis